jgi:ATP-dependent DNA helicase RecG
MTKSTPDLLNILGYESRSGNFKKAMINLLDTRLLERTLPGTPRSKKQGCK